MGLLILYVVVGAMLVALTLKFWELNRDISQLEASVAAPTKQYRKPDAQQLLLSIESTLWPDDDPDTAWAADTLQTVADLMLSAGYGPGPVETK